MNDPLLTNERAEREWRYLRMRFSEEKLNEALTSLPGDRKPYPLNVARMLGVKLPKPDDLPQIQRPKALDDRVARAELIKMKALIGIRNSES